MVFYGYKHQRFEDFHEAMKIIKTMYNINDDWSNLNLTSVLLSVNEQREIEELEKQMEQQNLEQKQKIDELERRNLELQQNSMQQSINQINF